MTSTKAAGAAAAGTKCPPGRDPSPRNTSGKEYQMNPKQLATTVVGMLVLLKDPNARDERGLSQSAETAIIVAGAVAIATVIVALVTAFVQAQLAKI
jgi:hypothetical protein